jgi:hypothetical protein
MSGKLPSPANILLRVITEEHAPRYLFEALRN